MGLFGKDKPPEEKAKEKVNELSAKLRQESRQLDRQIRTIEREELKTVASIKESAKKNQKDVCKILAKSLVHARKQKSRIYKSQAEINSIVMQMKQQVAQMKMAGCMKTSTEVMKSMQNLIKLPELQKVAQELSKEMMRAGIIDEMINDSIDTALDDDDTEDLADEEVERVLNDVLKGKLNDLPSVATESVGTDRNRIGVAAAAAAVSDDEEDADDMTKRLEALRS